MRAARASIFAASGKAALKAAFVRNIGEWSSEVSVVLHLERYLRKLMDLALWIGVNRSDAEWYREGKAGHSGSLLNGLRLQAQTRPARVTTTP